MGHLLLAVMVNTLMNLWIPVEIISISVRTSLCVYVRACVYIGCSVVYTHKPGISNRKSSGSNRKSTGSCSWDDGWPSRWNSFNRRKE